jgi:hypothetical protein
VTNGVTNRRSHGIRVRVVEVDQSQRAAADRRRLLDGVCVWVGDTMPDKHISDASRQSLVTQKTRVTFIASLM